MSLPYPLRLVSDGISEIVQLDNSVQTASNDGDTLTTLYSFTLPADTVASNGDTIAFEFFGNFSAVVGANLLAYCGDALLFDSGAINPAATSWYLQGKIVRTDVTSGKVFAFLLASDRTIVMQSTQTLDWAVDNLIKVVGEAPDPGDVDFECGVLYRLGVQS